MQVFNLRSLKISLSQHVYRHISGVPGCTNFAPLRGWHNLAGRKSTFKAFVGVKRAIFVFFVWLAESAFKSLHNECLVVELLQAVEQRTESHIFHHRALGSFLRKVRTCVLACSFICCSFSFHDGRSCVSSGGMMMM